MKWLPGDGLGGGDASCRRVEECTAGAERKAAEELGRKYAATHDLTLLARRYLTHSTEEACGDDKSESLHAEDVSNAGVQLLPCERLLGGCGRGIGVVHQDEVGWFGAEGMPVRSKAVGLVSECQPLMNAANANPVELRLHPEKNQPTGGAFSYTAGAFGMSILCSA